MATSDERAERLTTRERRENKASRRREWQAGRQRKTREAAAARESAREALPPMGEPIKVGHHSEGKHRRAIERFDRAHERTLEHEQMAQRHATAAAAIEHELESAIYSDDEDVGERLRERIAGLEARRERIKELNREIRKAHRAGRNLDEWAQEFEIGDAERRELMSFARIDGSLGFPGYVLGNLGGRISRDRQRLAALAREQGADA